MYIESYTKEMLIFETYAPIVFPIVYESNPTVDYNHKQLKFVCQANQLVPCGMLLPLLDTLTSLNKRLDSSIASINKRRTENIDTVNITFDFPLQTDFHSRSKRDIVSSVITGMAGITSGVTLSHLLGSGSSADDHVLALRRDLAAEHATLVKFAAEASLSQNELRSNLNDTFTNFKYLLGNLSRTSREKYDSLHSSFYVGDMRTNLKLLEIVDVIAKIQQTNAYSMLIDSCKQNRLTLDVITVT